MSTGSQNPQASTASGAMTEKQQAMHDLYIHQDNLLWSRTQTLFAIQAAALAGAYAIHADATILAGSTLVLTVVLTAILWKIVFRDLDYRNAARDAAGIMPALPPVTLNGQRLLHIIFGLSLMTDVVFVAWVFMRHYVIVPIK